MAHKLFCILTFTYVLFSTAMVAAQTWTYTPELRRLDSDGNALPPGQVNVPRDQNIQFGLYFVIETDDPSNTTDPLTLGSANVGVYISGTAFTTDRLAGIVGDQPDPGTIGIGWQRNPDLLAPTGGDGSAVLWAAEVGGVASGSPTNRSFIGTNFVDGLQAEWIGGSGVGAQCSGLPTCEIFMGTFTMDPDATGGPLPDEAVGDMTLTLGGFSAVSDPITAAVAQGVAGPAVLVDVADGNSISYFLCEPAGCPVTASFGQAVYDVTEGDSVNVEVSLSEARSSEVMIPITVAASSTALPADYVVPATVTIPANATTGTLTVIAVENTDDVPGPVDTEERTLVLEFGTLTGGIEAGSPVTTTVNIADNDDPAVTVSFGAASYSGTEGGTVDVEVTLTLPSTTPATTTPEREVVIPIASVLEGGAVAGDFSGLPSSVTFAADASTTDLTQSFTISVVDNTVEGDRGKNIALSFGSLPTGVTAGTQASANVALQDNDSDNIVLSILPATLAEAGAATPVTVTGTLDLTSMAALASEVVVTLSLAGTAVNPDDYTAGALPTLTFPVGAAPGATAEAMVTLTPVEDTVVEPNETIVIGGTATGFGVTAATLNLTDADTATVSLTCPACNNVAEGGMANFIATLSAPVGAEVIVPWSASGVDESDLGATSGEVMFTPGGSLTQTISLPITDDTLSEGVETVTVTLGAATGELELRITPATGGQDRATATIEAGDPLTVSLTGPNAAREGQDATYTVSLDGNNRGSVDVMATIELGGPGDDSIPDADATDFEGETFPLMLTIPAGMPSASFTLDILNTDESGEDDEELILMLTGATGGGGAAAPTVDTDADTIITIISELDLEGRTQAMENTLAVFGRSVAGDLVRMMEARTSSARSASQSGSQAIIGGKRLSADWLRSALSGKKAAATGGDTSTGGTTIADGDGNTVTGAPALVGGETTALGGSDFVTGAGGLATDGDTSAELSSIQPTVALVRDGLSMVGLNVGETGVSYHSVDLRRLLAGSSFQLALNGEGGQAGSWTVWGRGSITNFDGRPGNDFSVDGDMFSGQIGIDTHVNANMLAGLAVNYSEGDSDYDFTGGTRGNIETELTSVHPYVQWSGESGLDLWVMLGYGEGDATLEDESGAVETDLDMKMAAAGVRRDVDQLGYLDWALKADVFFMRLEADEQVDLLNAVEADTWQLRLALEGSKDLLLDGDASMKGIGEIGWRLDGGDAETGMGIEIGGGLDYANPNAGITVNARGHYLLAHRDSDFDEWGASISASFDPGVVGRGLRLSLTPTLGAASGGADRLWEDNSLIESAVDNLDDSVTPDMTMGAEAAYGMAVMNDRGLFTPFSELSWSDQNSRTRLGARMELLMPSRMDIGFAFYGEQEYQAGAADGVSGVLESRVRRSFAHDMGVIDLFGKMQSGTSDDYQIGVETKLNF